jgi:hypothetical protein
MVIGFRTPGISNGWTEPGPAERAEGASARFYRDFHRLVKPWSVHYR